MASYSWWAVTNKMRRTCGRLIVVSYMIFNWWNSWWVHESCDFWFIFNVLLICGWYLVCGHILDLALIFGLKLSIINNVWTNVGRNAEICETSSKGCIKVSKDFRRTDAIASARVWAWYARVVVRACFDVEERGCILESWEGENSEMELARPTG